MKRKHVRLPEKLAAALACLLPEAVCKRLRDLRVPALQVISEFHFHHIAYHADGGEDLWWNLHPMRTLEHEERTAKIDTPAIWKGKRIRSKQTEHDLRMTDGRGLFGIEKRHHSTHVMESLISIDEARKLYPDILLPHPDTTAPMPREVYSGRSTKPFRIIGRGFDKTKTRGFDGKVRAKKKSGTRRR